jgi:hypothetical protein
MNKSQAKNLMLRVKEVFNEWDFLGVVGAGPEDEYDCLVGPVTRFVSEKRKRDEIKAFIEKELDEHFGLSGNYSRDNLNQTLDKLMRLQEKESLTGVVSLADALRYEKVSGDAIGKGFKLGTGKIKRSELRPIFFSIDSFNNYYGQKKDDYSDDDFAFASLSASFILDRFLKSEEELPMIFSCIEEMLVEGDEDLCNVVTTGILEDLQNFTVLEGLHTSNFDKYLGAETKKWWDDIFRFWRNVQIHASQKGSAVPEPAESGKRIIKVAGITFLVFFGVVALSIMAVVIFT